MPIFVAQCTIEDLRDFVEELEWVEGGSQDEPAWQPPSTEAIVRWWELDDGWGAFVVQGEEEIVPSNDLAAVFELCDDVDVMNAIAAAAAPEEVVYWARMLGVFAAGDEPLADVCDVLKGLMTSDRADFAGAAVRGLARARWTALTEVLRQTGERWPELAEDCERALASIRRSPVRGC